MYESGLKRVQNDFQPLSPLNLLVLLSKIITLDQAFL